MKHFTITSDTEAAALRPFASEPLKVGHIITPSVGIVTHTAWDDYPESDALTLEQCMAIVGDEVTEDVLREVGEFCNRATFDESVVSERGSRIARMKNGRVYLMVQDEKDLAGIFIPNPTATKIKLLAAILRGEKI
jgi:hypothetical protein